MKLVNNAKQFYKMWSVWAFAAISVIPLIEENWGYFSEIIPGEYHAYVVASFGIVGIILRVIKQRGIDGEN